MDAENGTITFRRARAGEAGAVRAVLLEAAAWLESVGLPLWRDDELAAEEIEADVAHGLFILAESDGVVAGVMRFQLEDPETWPDVPDGDSAFVHRLAVRRRFAGRGVSTALLHEAIRRTRALGRRCLRLDCEHDRPKLRAFYEAHGFRWHSDRRVDTFVVARFEYPVYADASEP